VLVSHALFARILLPAEVGLYHLAVFICGVGATLAIGGVSSAATRFIALEAGRGSGVAPAIARRIVLAAAAGVLLVVVGGAVALSFGSASWRPASLGAMLGFFAAYSLRLAAAGVAGGYAEFGVQAGASLATALVMPIGAAWLWFHHGDASGALWVTAAQAAATGGLVLLRLRDRLRGGAAIPSEVGRSIWRYCGGVTAILLLDAVVWQQSEAVFLRLLSAPAELGLYTVAFTLVAQAMQLLPGSLGAAVFPTLAYHAGEGRERDLAEVVSRSTRLIAIATVPIAGFGIAFAREVMVALYGAQFVEGAAALRVLWLGGASGALAMAAAAALYAVGRERVLIAIGLPAAALSITLDLVLVAPYGAVGAAVANSVTQLVGAGAALVAANRLLGGSTFPARSLVRVVAAVAVAAAAARWLSRGTDGIVCLISGAAAFAAAVPASLFAFRETNVAAVRELFRGTWVAGSAAGTRR